MTYSNLLQHLVTLLNILLPLLHLLLLVQQGLRKLIFSDRDFSGFFPLQMGILLLKLLWLSSVLRNFVSGELSPLLKELNVVLLGLLFYQFVVGVHFPHQIHMSLVHFFHVLLNPVYVLSCKFKRHQVLLSLGRTFIWCEFVICDRLVLKVFEGVFILQWFLLSWTCLSLISRHWDFGFRWRELIWIISFVEKATVSLNKLYCVHLGVFWNRRHAARLVLGRLFGGHFFCFFVRDVVLVAKRRWKLFLANLFWSGH